MGGMNYLVATTTTIEALKYGQQSTKIPTSLRKILASALLPLGRKIYEIPLGRKIERLSNYLLCNSMFDCYKVQICASQVEIDKLLQFDGVTSVQDQHQDLDGYQAMMYADAKCYLLMTF